MKISPKYIYILFILILFLTMVYIVTHCFINFSNKENINSNSDSSQSSKYYDTKVISDAYLTKDKSKLSEFDKQIYEKAVNIIDTIIKEDMSNYDKELSIHDYITTHTTYDNKNLGVFKDISENSDNPYGTLIMGTAICTGYTTTFKMFMDMFEIPNKIIFAKDSNNEDHAWNMVELDNEWYYVDVTWNDPIPDEESRPALHKYFNVTENFLKENRHIWDSRDLPKANSTKYAYENMSEKSKEEAEYEIQTMY